MLRSPEQSGMERVGHLVVTDDMPAIQRHSPPRADGCNQVCAGAVLGTRVQAGGVCKSLVLDSNRASVVVPVAIVPCDVFLGHHLGDLTAVGDDVMGRPVAGRVLKRSNCAPVAALDVMDDDEVDRVV